MSCHRREARSPHGPTSCLGGDLRSRARAERSVLSGQRCSRGASQLDGGARRNPPAARRSARGSKDTAGRSSRCPVGEAACLGRAPIRGGDVPVCGSTAVSFFAGTSAGEQSATDSRADARQYRSARGRFRGATRRYGAGGRWVGQCAFEAPGSGGRVDPHFSIRHGWQNAHYQNTSFLWILIPLCQRGGGGALGNTRWIGVRPLHRRRRG